MLVANLAANARARPELERTLWQWLAVAALLVVAFPAARGHSLWFGPAAFWLLGAPIASLSMFYRHELAAAWRGILLGAFVASAAPRRRRPMTFVLPGPQGGRDSLRLPVSGASNATHLDPLPGRRPARQQRRSSCDDRRYLPVAGRR